MYERNLKGTTVDENDKPLPGVEVTITNGDAALGQATSNENGAYALTYSVSEADLANPDFSLQFKDKDDNNYTAPLPSDIPKEPKAVTVTAKLTIESGQPQVEITAIEIDEEETVSKQEKVQENTETPLASNENLQDGDSEVAEQEKKQEENSNNSGKGKNENKNVGNTNEETGGGGSVGSTPTPAPTPEVTPTPAPTPKNTSTPTPTPTTSSNGSYVLINNNSSFALHYAVPGSQSSYESSQAIGHSKDKEIHFQNMNEATHLAFVVGTAPLFGSNGYAGELEIPVTLGGTGEDAADTLLVIFTDVPSSELIHVEWLLYKGNPDHVIEQGGLDISAPLGSGGGNLH
ncbi:carboxypeptidase-like regulatory domain-containing protein [Oligoflexia bacterium]|nr:carboxypeptidase-like regulatory domain-containing protein [Oligoflexia bacterium]